MNGFEWALRAMKDGYKVARLGWNGKDMWLCLSPGNHAVPAGKFWAPHNRAFALKQKDGCAAVAPYITMKTADNRIVPWVASQTDLLGEDWTLVN